MRHRGFVVTVVTATAAAAVTIAWLYRSSERRRRRRQQRQQRNTIIDSATESEAATIARLAPTHSVFASLRFTAGGALAEARALRAALAPAPPEARRS